MQNTQSDTSAVTRARHVELRSVVDMALQDARADDMDADQVPKHVSNWVERVDSKFKVHGFTVEGFNFDHWRIKASCEGEPIEIAV